MDILIKGIEYWGVLSCQRPYMWYLFFTDLQTLCTQTLYFAWTQTNHNLFQGTLYIHMYNIVLIVPNTWISVMICFHTLVKKTSWHASLRVQPFELNLRLKIEDVHATRAWLSSVNESNNAFGIGRISIAKLVPRKKPSQALKCIEGVSVPFLHRDPTNSLKISIVSKSLLNRTGDKQIDI